MVERAKARSGETGVPHKNETSARSGTVQFAPSGTVEQQRLIETARLAALEHLVALDQKTREVANEVELRHLMVNETREITGARQIFYLQRTGNGKMTVRAVSSIGVVDRDAPLIRWVEQLVARLGKKADANGQLSFDVRAFDEKDKAGEAYPFRAALWQPLMEHNGNKAYGGLLQTRENPFSDRELALSRRQAQVYSHTHDALMSKPRISLPSGTRRWLWAAGVVAMLVLAILPVPLTTIAPVEVVPHKPFIVASPIDGVVDEIVAPPNKRVKKGELLVRFDDTALRNRHALAEREMRVAEAEYRKSVQGAFGDEDARRSLAITKAEFALKQADLDYARDLLKHARLHAPTSGLLIYSDPQRWKGRPVQTGERIMMIANEKRTILEIELPVGDAIVLNDGARVKVFLDADPLHPLEAIVETSSYQAEPSATDQLVYRVQASLGDDQAPPRIGARGTAQIFGDEVSLAFFLFRRPITTVRQFLGL